MVAKLDHGASAAQQNTNSPPLNCPRCDSTNTKFCYYNNYSLAQPRHFCKSCKRYWTRGGTLRNVPIGGGSRKNKRSKKSSQSYRSSSSVMDTTTSLPPPPRTDLNSLLYGFPPIVNSSTVFFPKFEFDPQVPEFEENFHQPCHGAANLADLQKTATSFLGGYSLNSQMLTSSGGPMVAETYQPLIPYDDLEIGTENNASNKSIDWPLAVKEINPLEATSSGALAQSGYQYWNRATSSGWPESGSSVAPLI